MSRPDAWLGVCRAGLTTLVGTGLQGKPLASRIAASLFQFEALEPEVGSPNVLEAACSIREYCPEIPHMISEKKAIVEGLTEQQQKQLAQALVDVFLLGYAEERGSNLYPQITALQDTV